MYVKWFNFDFKAVLLPQTNYHSVNKEVVLVAQHSQKTPALFTGLPEQFAYKFVLEWLVRP